MVFFFFFNDTATTEIYTLSLHDALPIFFRDVLERSVALLAIQPIPILRAGLLRNPSFGGRVAERRAIHKKEIQAAVIIVVEQRSPAAHRFYQIFFQSVRG